MIRSQGDHSPGKPGKVEEFKNDWRVAILSCSLSGHRIDSLTCVSVCVSDMQVLDSRVLPNYGYRDDGLLLFKAVDTYVSKVVRCYYGNLRLSSLLTLATIVISVVLSCSALLVVNVK